MPPVHDSIPEAWLDILDTGIKHRGPDGQGRYRDRAARPDGSAVDVAFVHRRLVILDHAGGAQPMASPDGSATLVFNGCIYNHRELRAELETLGHKFTSDHSDTEVLLHGWKRWECGVWAKARGMFAAAVWDRATGELTIARDMAGEKPLYQFFSEGSVFVFSSVPASLVRCAIAMHAAGLVHRPESDVLRIAHAMHWLKFGCGEASGLFGDLSAGSSSTVRWDRICSPSVRLPRTSFADRVIPPGRTNVISAEAVEATLSAAVRGVLDADVPVGCFLSGGVDSSLVAAFAARAGGKIKTLCVRSPDARYDESAYAAKAAAHLGTVHTTLDCAGSPAEDLVMLIEQLGLPFGDSSLLPTYWACKAAREQLGMKVMLSGDGGDELFAGYERYKAFGWLTRWERPLRWIPTGLGRGSHPKSALSKLGRLGNAARYGYTDLLAIFDHESMMQLVPAYAAQYEHARTDQESVREDGPDFATGDVMRWEFAHHLPQDMLRKVDTASMAVALEVRAPFLSADVVRLAISATLGSLMPGGQRKGLLRAVARKYLPADIVDRPKMGFAIPIGDWFRSDYGGMKTLLVDTVVSPAEPFPENVLGFALSRTVVSRLIDEHMAGQRDHGQRLYMLTVLAVWCGWMGKQRRTAHANTPAPARV